MYWTLWARVILALYRFGLWIWVIYNLPSLRQRYNFLSTLFTSLCFNSLPIYSSIFYQFNDLQLDYQFYQIVYQFDQQLLPVHGLMYKSLWSNVSSKCFEQSFSIWWCFCTMFGKVCKQILINVNRFQRL